MFWHWGNALQGNDNTEWSNAARQALQRLSLRQTGPTRHAMPIGLIGPREATAEQLQAAGHLGYALADAGMTILCGGKGGVMEAAAYGAARAGGQYTNGPFAIGAAYMQANNTYGANGGAWTGAYDGTFASSINEGFASARNQQIIAAASTYQIGPVTLGVSYSNTQYTPGSFSLFTAKETFNSAGLTVAYQATSALRLAAGYDYTQGSSINGGSAPKYNQFNFASYYFLSKRTALYGLVGYQKASGKTLDAFGNVVNATASVGDVGNGISSASNAQTLVRVGIRQTF